MPTDFFNCFPFSTKLYSSHDSIPNCLGAGKEPGQLFLWGWISTRLGRVIFLFCSCNVYVSWRFGSYFFKRLVLLLSTIFLQQTRCGSCKYDIWCMTAKKQHHCGDLWCLVKHLCRLEFWSTAQKCLRTTVLQSAALKDYKPWEKVLIMNNSHCAHFDSTVNFSWERFGRIKIVLLV